MSGARVWASLVLGLVCAAGPACASDATVRAESAEPDDRPWVAVAPFASPDGEAGAAAPAEGPASRLAVRLARGGRVRVVPPSALEASIAAEAAEEPRAESVRRWARDEGWDAVVVGRSRAEDDVESVALEVRSGHSGAALSRLEATLRPEDGADDSLDALASQIEAALGLAPVPPPSGGPASVGSGPATPGSPAEGDGPTVDASAPPPASPAPRASLGVAGFDSDEPINIQSDVLEVVEKGDRRIHFRGNVRVEQDDVVLTTDALEAVYPKGESRPSRLVARGDVHVVQGDREARCDEATYVRSDSLLTCTGRAELRQGCDVVRGSEITFDLAADRVRVEGAASVVIHPGRERAGGGDATAPPAECVEEG